MFEGKFVVIMYFIIGVFVEVRIFSVFNRVYLDIVFFVELCIRNLMIILLVVFFF